MRSIIEKKNEVKDKRKIQGLLIFMLGILVISSLGYAFLSNPNSDSNTGNQNQQGQQNENGQWMEYLNGQALPFTYPRKQVSWITVNTSIKLSDYYQREVYLVSKDSTRLKAELGQTLGVFTGRIQDACLGACEGDLPEKTCQDLVIVWNSSASGNIVYQKDKCVFIEGGIESVDAFLYSLG